MKAVNDVLAITCGQYASHQRTVHLTSILMAYHVQNGSKKFFFQVLKNSRDVMSAEQIKSHSHIFMQEQCRWDAALWTNSNKSREAPLQNDTTSRTVSHCFKAEKRGFKFVIHSWLHASKRVACSPHVVSSYKIAMVDLYSCATGFLLFHEQIENWPSFSCQCLICGYLSAIKRKRKSELQLCTSSMGEGYRALV